LIALFDGRALAGKNKNAPMIRKRRMIGKSRHLARDRLDNRLAEKDFSWPASQQSVGRVYTRSPLHRGIPLCRLNRLRMNYGDEPENPQP
jgi:hypothetical protein